MTQRAIYSAPSPATQDSPPSHRGQDAVEFEPVLAVDPRISPSYRRLIEAACIRPDLAPLVDGTGIALDVDLGTVFRVERGEQLMLGPRALANPIMTAVCLRHGLELAQLMRLTPHRSPGARALALGLLAIRTAGFHVQALGAAERNSCRSLLPRWQREAFDLLTVARPAAVPKDMLAALAGPVLELQSLGFSPVYAGAKDSTDWSLVSDILDLAGTLAMPVERLLKDGLEQASPPAGLVPAAERLRRDLLSAAVLGDLGAACVDEWKRWTGETKADVEPTELFLLMARRSKL